MANYTNPRKIFQFSIQVQGMDPFAVQEVDTADSEIDAIAHGDTNYDVFTAGRVTTSTLKIRKLESAFNSETDIWSWHYQCQDPFSGGGAIPTVYWKPIVVLEYAVDGLTILNRTEFLNCWPKKINGVSHKRRESANTIRDIEFQVERIRRV